MVKLWSHYIQISIYEKKNPLQEVYGIVYFVYKKYKVEKLLIDIYSYLGFLRAIYPYRDISPLFLSSSWFVWDLPEILGSQVWFPFSVEQLS